MPAAVGPTASSFGFVLGLCCRPGMLEGLLKPTSLFFRGKTVDQSEGGGFVFLKNRGGTGSQTASQFVD